MGIIDLHFHDSKLEFAPHIGPKEESTPGAEESNSETPSIDVGASDAEESKRLASNRAAQGVGALIALGFLIGVGVLVRKVGGGEEDLPAESTAESEGPAAVDVTED